METINVRIRKSSYDRLKTVCLNSKLSITDLIEIASLSLSTGIIDIDAIKLYKDQILNKTIEVALKKEQSVTEAAGMSYNKTEWGNVPEESVKAKTYSMMDRG